MTTDTDIRECAARAADLLERDGWAPVIDVAEREDWLKGRRGPPARNISAAVVDACRADGEVTEEQFWTVVIETVRRCDQIAGNVTYEWTPGCTADEVIALLRRVANGEGAP